MTSFRVLPRFKHLVAEEQQKVERKIIGEIKERNDPFRADALPGHINLIIPIEQRHFWSPQLNLTFEQTEEGTIIRGLYGPNPTVWAIFFFGYVVIGLSFMFLGMWGLTQLSLEIETNVLWFLPGLATAAVVLYLIAQGGQKIGSQQMYDLHHFYEEVIHEKVIVN